MRSTAINLPFGDGLHHPMFLPHYIMLYSILTWDADPSVTKTILECTMLIRKKAWVVWICVGYLWAFRSSDHLAPFSCADGLSLAKFGSLTAVA